MTRILAIESSGTTASVAVLEEADASLAELIQSAGADLLTKPLDELPLDAQTVSAIKEKLFELK